MQRIDEKRILPAATVESADAGKRLAEALLAGGLDILEITFRTPAAAAAIEAVAAEFPEMLLGAGTVLAVEQLDRACDAGVAFAVAPGLNPVVVQRAGERGVTFVPGVMTPTEIEAAMALDCRLLKFFPAEAAGGLAVLKALAGPYGHTGIRFVPTGGISAANAAAYLALKVVAAVGGSWMVPGALIQEGRWEDITRITREAVSLAAGVTRA